MSTALIAVEPVTVSNVCRLCQVHCGGNHKCINGENSEMNEVYKITVKYFPAKFLEPSWISPPAALCLECWRHIIEFHSFQESIFDTQKKLLGRQREGDIEMKDETILYTNNHVYITPGVVKLKLRSSPLSDITLKSEVLSDENSQNSENKSANNPAKILNDSKLPCKEEYHIDISLSDLEDIDIQFSTDDEMSLSSSIDTRKEVEIKTPTQIMPQCNVSQNSPNCDGKGKKSDDHISLVKDNDKVKCKPELQCWICSKTVATFDLLQKHFEVHHRRGECYITCCHLKLTSKHELEEHIGGKHSIQKHTQATLQCNVSRDSQTCDGKGKKSVDHKRLVKDIDKAKCKPKLQCWICDKTASTFDLLEYHFELYHPRRQCFITCCEMKLTSKRALEKHTYVKPTRIEACDAKRKKSVDYTSVVKDIDKAKCKPKLQCWICCKTASTFDLLQTHFDEYHHRWQCFITCCELKLTSKLAFEKHTGVKHTRMERFMCEICKIEYPSASVLIKHQLQRHISTANIQHSAQRFCRRGKS